MFTAKNINNLSIASMAITAVLLTSACSSDGSGTSTNQAPNGVANTADNPAINNGGDAPTGESAPPLINTPDATTATSHATVQQQFIASPLISNAIAQGQSVDFNASDAEILRSLLSGKMVTYNGKLQQAEGLSSIDFTLVHIYCTGGKFVMFKTVSENAFNPDLPSELNPVLTGQTNEERVDGVWETAVVSGVDIDGSAFANLNVINMFDFADAFAQSGQTLNFPQPGQSDSVSGQFLLTSNGQALAPDPDFWVPVLAADQQGVQVAGQNEISRILPAPNVCG